MKAWDVACGAWLAGWDCMMTLTLMLLTFIMTHDKQQSSGSGVYCQSLTLLSSPADASKFGSVGDHLTQLTSAECAFCFVVAR